MRAEGAHADRREARMREYRIIDPPLRWRYICLTLSSRGQLVVSTAYARPGQRADYSSPQWCVSLAGLSAPLGGLMHAHFDRALVALSAPSLAAERAAEQVANGPHKVGGE
jgi:hypothetical protein